MAARQDEPVRLLPKRNVFPQPIDLVGLVQASVRAARGQPNPWMADLSDSGLPLLPRREWRLPDRLDRSQIAKAIAGDVGLQAGRVLGVGRGAVHTARDLGEGAYFLGRLAVPALDMASPPGQSAPEQLASAAGVGLGYVRSRVADPGQFVADVGRGLDKLNVSTNPYATPVAGTATDEFKRNLGLGANQGEIGFDVATSIYGPGELRALTALKPLSREQLIAKYVAQGFNARKAEYLAAPYEGMGAHYLPRRTKLPSPLGGGPVPRPIMDSRFNVLRPKGISRGEMYELHYRTDNHFRGAGLGERGRGTGWSGRRLGLTKFGPLGRAWYGAPDPLKTVVVGVPARAALSSKLVNDDLREDRAWDW